MRFSIIFFAILLIFPHRTFAQVESPNQATGCNNALYKDGPDAFLAANSGRWIPLECQSKINPDELEFRIKLYSRVSKKHDFIFYLPIRSVNNKSFPAQHTASVALTQYELDLLLNEPGLIIFANQPGIEFYKKHFADKLPVQNIRLVLNIYTNPDGSLFTTNPGIEYTAKDPESDFGYLTKSFDIFSLFQKIEVRSFTQISPALVADAANSNKFMSMFLLLERKINALTDMVLKLRRSR